MIPVFTLAKGVKNLFDANGQPVGKAELHTIYTAGKAHSELGKKLYSGEFDNNKLEAAIKGYHSVTKPSGLGKPVASALTATGAKLTWAKPTGGSPVATYNLRVTKAGKDITGSPFNMGTKLTKTLTGLDAATAYKAVVDATNAGGNVLSPEVSFTTTTASTGMDT